MWCSKEMKKSYTLNNLNKTVFCEKLYFFNFCQNRIQSQKDLVLLGFFFPSKSTEIKIGFSISLLLDCANSAG